MSIGYTGLISCTHPGIKLLQHNTAYHLPALRVGKGLRQQHMLFVLKHLIELCEIQLRMHTAGLTTSFLLIALSWKTGTLGALTWGTISAIQLGKVSTFALWPLVSAAIYTFTEHYLRFRMQYYKDGIIVASYWKMKNCSSLTRWF